MKEIIVVTVGVLLFFAILFCFADRSEARKHVLKMAALENGCVVLD